MPFPSFTLRILRTLRTSDIFSVLVHTNILFQYIGYIYQTQYQISLRDNHVILLSSRFHLRLYCLLLKSFSNCTEDRLVYTPSQIQADNRYFRPSSPTSPLETAIWLHSFQHEVMDFHHDRYDRRKAHHFCTRPENVFTATF